MIQNHWNQLCLHPASALWLLIWSIFLVTGNAGCSFVRQFPDPTHVPHPHPVPPPTPRPVPVPVPTPPAPPKPKPIVYHSPRVVPTDCPVDGTAKSVKVQALNELKNRTDEPTRYAFIPIDTILQAPRDAYTEHQGIYTEGYIIEIKRSGPETCNCGSRTDKDIHIVLAPSPDDFDNNDKMIVEITPRLQINVDIDDLKRFENSKTKIRVFGWLFFDAEHIGAKWRGTEWEIHPITDIEVVEEEKGK
jgi:hypothetical protein